ncbi:MAG TPA: HGGxSTG domain-containing protein [Candidatus Binatia bacterium]|nr:HGGxSTG domain-containing protein [Candidatus Binatia bacterium]
MSDKPLAREREPIERVRARLEALVRANAAPRCGARSKRTGKPCRGAAMPNGRCKLHGGKSTGCQRERSRSSSRWPVCDGVLPKKQCGRVGPPARLHPWCTD